jgi:sortase A
MAAAGRALLTLGVLTLLFVAYQLWGTGIAESHSQDSLRRQLAGQLQHGRPVPPPAQTASDSGATPSTSTATAAPPTEAPPDGSPEGQVKIPKLGVDQVFVEGTTSADLRRGPGHYLGTPLPGQPGNASLAGHRTTYGAPFYNLDKLHPGDQIVVTASWGTFWYDVRRSFVVNPSDVAVIAPSSNNQLTLTTCTPRFSATQRLIVQASLVGAPAAALAVSPRPIHAASSVASSDGTWLRVAAWLLAAVAVAVGAWGLARRRRRRWPVYAVLAPGLLAVLFMLFASISVMLPDTF